MRTFFTFILLIITGLANAQTKKLIVNPYLNLPKDSIDAKALVSSLDSFLVASQKPNEQNKYILPAEKIETFIQLDEVNGIEKSDRFKDKFFYKPYLTNVVLIDKNTYLIKISYIGSSENKPILTASFEFIAHKVGDLFLFASPLVRNTKNWKKITEGNNTFIYQNTINMAQVNAFSKLAGTFDKKLKVENKKCEFYLNADFVALQKLIGVDYKLEYNGYAENTLTSDFENRKLILLGSNSETFDSFDPHDLWHDRLSLVISRRKVNKPIDEGCAYLYGGSWGMTWKDIFTKFKTKVCVDKDIDWLAGYGKFNNFGESDAAHLMSEYVLNALFIQKIEKEKGFEGVWEFLNCGPYEKSNEKYFKALEKLIGISKANFNVKVWELINAKK